MRTGIVMCVVIIIGVNFLGSAPTQVLDVQGGTLNSVSLIRLIANPQSFDGRRIKVTGYIAHNGLDSSAGLYVTELDGSNFVVSNSVDLSIEDSHISRALGKYAVLEGIYRAPKGQFADYLDGKLDHVSVIKTWNSGDVPR
jgi:hypothetical protein